MNLSNDPLRSGVTKDQALASKCDYIGEGGDPAKSVINERGRAILTNEESPDPFPSDADFFANAIRSASRWNRG